MPSFSKCPDHPEEVAAWCIFCVDLERAKALSLNTTITALLQKQRQAVRRLQKAQKDRERIQVILAYRRSHTTPTK